MPSQRDSFLVIGGSGFLGRHIVQALVVRGDPVAVFDIVQRYHDTPFYSGDISDQAQVSDAIRKVHSIPLPMSHRSHFSLRAARPVSSTQLHPPRITMTRLSTGKSM
jgi:nucleoside-diphosphate-sugar epimerase